MPQAAPAATKRKLLQMPIQTIADFIQLLSENEEAAGRTLSMVPSENSMSALAKLPFMLDVYHRYFFNRDYNPNRWNFRGSELTGRLEIEATDAILAELGKAKYVNSRPLSGLNAMTLVLAALGGRPGATILTVAPDNGGHYATIDVARRMGLRVKYLPSIDIHTFDYAAAGEVIAASRPSLVYVDQSNCLFPMDVSQISSVVKHAYLETVLHVDASHWMGLVLGGAHPNPLDCGADSFGGSTHKTFPGPQKAVFLTRRQDLATKVRQAEDYLISSHHFAATLSLGIALMEFRDFGGSAYAQNILHNTRRFAECIHAAGIPVEGADLGFSAGHQLWIDTERVGLPARAVSDLLSRAGLLINVQPFLPGIPHEVVRIGLNEATFRGLGAEDMAELADIFGAAAFGRARSVILANRVAALRSNASHPYGCPPEIRQPLIAGAVRLCERVLAGR
jgi:glycine hydroxymethyltransferase